jgi:hypothetical protein
LVTNRIVRTPFVEQRFRTFAICPDADGKDMARGGRSLIDCLVRKSVSYEQSLTQCSNRPARPDISCELGGMPMLFATAWRFNRSPWWGFGRAQNSDETQQWKNRYGAHECTE